MIEFYVNYKMFITVVKTFLLNFAYVMVVCC